MGKSEQEVSHEEVESPSLPKYHVLKEALLERIISGVWQAGQAIPTEQELCRDFGVSRITVRRAISELVHEERLRTVQGKGTFVASPKVPEHFIQRAFGIYEDMERRGIHLTTQVVRQEVITAPREVAQHLQLQPDEKVQILVRVRSVENEKILVSTTYLPEYLCPGLENIDLSTGSLYRLLKERYNLTIARGVRGLEAVAADQWSARLLDIAFGSPLLRLDSLAYLADGRPFEYSQALHSGERARVEVEFFPGLDDHL